MSIPASRQDLKEWCLRELGSPVIEVNVDDDQLDDRIDEALQFFQDFHFDGTERGYFKYQLTETDFTNEYIPIDNANGIIGITRIFSLASSGSNNNMFDMKYQFRMNELQDFASTSYVNYVITMQHLRTIDILFNGEQPVRFNRHTDKLYIDWNWKNNYVKAGDYIIIEAFFVANPADYPKVYNDRMLKRLATQYVKRQWGTNMKKFGGMQLPGGITMNGQQIYNEADTDIKTLEDQIRSVYEAPPNFIMG